MGLRMRVFLIVVVSLLFMEFFMPLTEFLVGKICEAILTMTGGDWNPFWLEDSEQLSAFITFCLSAASLLFLTRQRKTR